MLITEPMEQSRLLDVVFEAISGGVNAVQLRDKTQAEDDLVETARALKSGLGDCLLLVNGRPTVAEVSGVHLPADGPRIPSVRAIVGPNCMIGRSTHSVGEAVAADDEGADYLIFGTIFESRSHPGIEPAGIQNLRAVRLALDRKSLRRSSEPSGSGPDNAAGPPVIAIGGIDPDNCGQCLAAGAAGVAVLSGILHAAEPRSAAKQYWDALTRS
jgi:thiamine-phosphate diphosphorylase